jgi:hypothetical protein
MGTIICLAFYPKSGNTWIRIILRNLLSNPQEPAGINTINQFSLGDDSVVAYARCAPRLL